MAFDVKHKLNIYVGDILEDLIGIDIAQILTFFSFPKPCGCVG